MQINLDFDKHIEVFIGKENKVIEIVSRSCDNKQKNNIMQLYQGLVRPLLEYDSSLDGYTNISI